MRMSRLFGRTLREAPAEAEVSSHQLMLRAALIRRLSSGIYSSLPLMVRAQRKIEAIIRQEMESIGGQEISMPVMQPAELWQESGRFEQIGAELMRLQDRGGREMVLAMTHEEAVTDLVRKEVDSYRQLPCMLFQLQTKFRDEPRPRAGLIRTREFVMKDAYSFHASLEDLELFYQQVCQAYHRIFQRCGLQVRQVESDTGLMGGSMAHEFTLLTDAGEDKLLICEDCGYAANQEAAQAGRKATAGEANPRPFTLVSTPDRKDIRQVAEYLGVGQSEIMKTMVYSTQDGLVLVVIRGDKQVNEHKLLKLLQDPKARLASEEETLRAGLITGYLSPIGLQGLRVLADWSIEQGKPYVAGANQAGFHLRDVVVGRDFQAEYADLSLAQGGDLCPNCQSSLVERRGIELGNTFVLGTKYSAAMQATFQDEQGTIRPVVMGCYGIGVGRLAASILEAFHDERGIVWPKSIAPYDVHLVTLGKDQELVAASEQVYRAAQSAGLDVLWDDRDATAGVKLTDADLLGMPVRLIVSKKNLQQGVVELKPRAKGDPMLVSMEQLIEAILRHKCS